MSFFIKLILGFPARFLVCVRLNLGAEGEKGSIAEMTRSTWTMSISSEYLNTIVFFGTLFRSLASFARRSTLWLLAAIAFFPCQKFLQCSYVNIHEKHFGFA